MPRARRSATARRNACCCWRRGACGCWRRNAALDGDDVGRLADLAVGGEGGDAVLIDATDLCVGIDPAKATLLAEALLIGHRDRGDGRERYAGRTAVDAKSAEVGHARAVGVLRRTLPAELNAFGDVRRGQVADPLRRGQLRRPDRRLTPAGRQGE